MKIFKNLCNHRTRSELSLNPPERSSSVLNMVIWTMQTMLKMVGNSNTTHHHKSGMAVHDYLLVLQILLLVANLFCVHTSIAEVFSVNNCSTFKSINVSEYIINGTLDLEESIDVLNISHPTLDHADGYLAGVTYKVEVTVTSTAYLHATLFLVTTITTTTTTTEDKAAVTAAGEWLLDGITEPTGEHCNGGVMVFPDPSASASSLATIELEWVAPIAEGRSECVQFLLFTSDVTPKLLQVKSFCPKTACYKVYLFPWRQLELLPQSTNCLYYIEVAPTHTIRLQIQKTAFLTKSATCNEWTIKVGGHSGDYSFSPCDAINDLSFQSEGNRMTVISSSAYYSDISLIASYYSINEFGRVGCQFALNALSATISNIYLPSQYFSFQNCVTITVPIHHRVQLEVTFMNISVNGYGLTCTDQNYLEIIEDSDNPFYSKKLCSQNTDNTTDLLVFQSSKNSMILLLHTYHRQISHFTAQYHSVHSCVNVISTSVNGTFHSTNYPHNYLNSQNCIYDIHCPEISDCGIYLKFDSLEIHNSLTLLYGGQRDSQCTGDYVQVSDGDKLNQKVCGNWRGLENQLIFSATGYIKVTFHSDHVATSRGFQARWQAVLKNSSHCPDDWVEYDDSCLYFFLIISDWFQAQETCNKNRSHLVKVNSKEKLSFISMQLQIRNFSTSGYAVWIGANDIQHEGAFVWADGTDVSPHQFWFPGWDRHGLFNRQPSDDGLSGEDCVELRNQFSVSSKQSNTTEELFWNDRKCDTLNYFICEKSIMDNVFREPTPVTRYPATTTEDICNQEINLQPWRQSISLGSPHYPNNYQENMNCTVNVRAPSGIAIDVVFTEFDFEFENNCNFDSLIIVEEDRNSPWKKCGSWTGREKLLSYSSETSQFHFHFVSDYSITGSGFLATFTARPASGDCPIGWSLMPSHTCKKTLSTKLTFNDALYLCLWWNSHLVLSQSQVLEKSNTSQIYEYMQDDGGLSVSPPERWICQKPLSSKRRQQFIINLKNKPSGSLPPYTIRSTFRNYPSNVDIRWVITLPHTDRILIQIRQLVLEYQVNCLYDSLAIYDASHTMLGSRYCGTISTPVHHDVHGNQAMLQLMTDDTNSMGALHIEYQGISTTSCKNQIISGRAEGTVSSLNFPNAYPGDLDCVWTISPSSLQERVLVTFRDVDIDTMDSLEIETGERGMAVLEITNETVFSQPSYVFSMIRINYRSHHFQGNRRGFTAYYQIVRGTYEAQENLTVYNNGSLLPLNFPLSYPPQYRHEWTLHTTLGYNLIIRAEEITPREGQTCEDESHLYVIDPHNKNSYTHHLQLCDLRENEYDNKHIGSVWSVTSYLNIVTVVLDSLGQGYPGDDQSLFSLKYFIVEDEEFLNKTKHDLDISLESCDNETCHNGGHCIPDQSVGFICQCVAIYRGLLCDWTFCDLEYCMNGAHCINGNQSYSCICVEEYQGSHCEIDPSQCDLDSCSGHGKCAFSKDYGSSTTIECVCDTGWQGKSCSLITPLTTVAMSEFTQRLVEEPFWIGIIVVFLVLFMTGTVIFACKFCDKHMYKIRRSLAISTKKTNNQEGVTGNDNPEFQHSNIEYSRTPSPSVYQFHSTDIPTIKIEQDTPSCSTSGHAEIVTEVTMEHGVSKFMEDVNHSDPSGTTLIMPLDFLKRTSKTSSLNQKSSPKIFSQSSDRTYDRNKKLTRQYSCDIESSDTNEQDRKMGAFDIGSIGRKEQLLANDEAEVSPNSKRHSDAILTLTPSTSNSHGRRKNSDQRRREFAQSVLLAKESYHFPAQSTEKDYLDDTFSRSCSLCSHTSVDVRSKSSSIESSQLMLHRYPHLQQYLSQSLDRESMDSGKRWKKHKSRSHRHSSHCDSCCSECRTQEHRHSSSSKSRHRSSSRNYNSRSSFSRSCRRHHGHNKEEKEDNSQYEHSRHTSKHSKEKIRGKPEKYRSSTSQLGLSCSSKSSPTPTHRHHRHHHKHHHHKGSHQESFETDDIISLRSYYSLGNSQRSLYGDSPKHISSRHFRVHKHRKQSSKQIANISVQSDETDFRRNLTHQKLCLTNSDSNVDKVNHHTRKTIRTKDLQKHKSHHKTSTEMNCRTCNSVTSISSLQVPLSISIDENISPKSGLSDLSVLTDDTSGISGMHYHNSDDTDCMFNRRFDNSEAILNDKYKTSETEEHRIMKNPAFYPKMQQYSPKHPSTDSAYQSKEQSTEHHYSMSNSSTVSPTLSNGFFLLKDSDGSYNPSVQPYPTSSIKHKNEDSKKISRQLQLAARKLHNIKDDQWKHWPGEQEAPQDQLTDDLVMEKFTLSKEDSYLNHWLQQTCSVKPRRLFPSRMLSMIKDEEHESDSPGKSPKKISKNSSIDETLTGKLLRLSQHHSAEFSPSETSTADPEAVLLEITDRENFGENKGLEKRQTKKVEDIDKQQICDVRIKVTNVEPDTEVDGVLSKTKSNGENNDKSQDKIEFFLDHQATSLNNFNTKDSSVCLNKQDISKQTVLENSLKNTPCATSDVYHSEQEFEGNMTSYANSCHNPKISNNTTDTDHVPTSNGETPPLSNGLTHVHLMARESYEMTSLSEDNGVLKHLDTERQSQFNSEQPINSDITTYINTKTAPNRLNSCNEKSSLNHIYPDNEFNTQSSVV